jgi:hypothetical protein
LVELSREKGVDKRDESMVKINREIKTDGQED